MDFEIFFFSADGKINKTFAKRIGITSRLVNAYDFYSGVAKNHKRTSEVRASERVSDSSQRVNKNRKNEPTMK